MTISQEIDYLMRKLSEEGDLPIFKGDMQELTEEDHRVVDSEERGKFLHIGEW